MKKMTATVLMACLALTAAVPAFAHCQIPCGIYGDEMRFFIIEEHITTIEKSMNQIKELSYAADQNVNQLARWVNNKEDHADALVEIVTQYFLSQRIKPADSGDKKAYADYTNKLTLLHKIMVHSMKAKQTTDQEHIDALRALTKEFKIAYLGKEAVKHLEEHHK